LKRRIGITGGLKERGVLQANIPRMAAIAEKDFTNGTNPRPALAADYERLFHAAM
jgi:alcohol dehydrogenase class IV